ncbi:hypothetical protein [Vibrio diazotrophicus]|uniref:hypothetical protein n=1 Tax=Vibrio diazotrophicus TaxID=685 RepID=UPI00142D9CF4|nr:hypothetical protein [Vibrio diazotrophicus]NIY94655.1 hypothetical protein [Vibrio diazotrophicus]
MTTEKYIEALQQIDWSYIQYHLSLLARGEQTRVSFNKKTFRNKHRPLIQIQNDIVLSIYDRISKAQEAAQ